VPLRNLKLEERRQIAGYNLGTLFRDEYFSQHVKSDDLAKAMWRASDSKCDRTVFILDGLDAISQDLDFDGSMFHFLQELLNQPNVVVTSRPYGELP
jgi:hypothetical protein